MTVTPAYKNVEGAPAGRWSLHLPFQRPPHEWFLARKSSPFVRLAQHHTALRAWCNKNNVCLVGENTTCSISALQACAGLWSYDYGHAWHEGTAPLVCTLAATFAPSTSTYKNASIPTKSQEGNLLSQPMCAPAQEQSAPFKPGVSKSIWLHSGYIFALPC